MFTRRQILAGSAASLLTGTTARADLDFSGSLAALEKANGGRLGVAMLEKGGARSAYRGDERFPLCSTHKALAAGFVLQRVDKGEETLDRLVIYDKSVLVTYSPVTGKHVDGGMTIGALCEAAVTVSDNSAANLLLATLGGPAGFTKRARALGDGLTRLDRIETALNEAAPGDPRDTTSPNAFADDLLAFAFGDALTPKSREQFNSWLVACQTGGARLRAGLPEQWRIGDKTGTGERGATNDVAIATPPGRAPLVIAAFYVGSEQAEPDRSHVLAEVGRIVARL